MYAESALRISAMTPTAADVAATALTSAASGKKGAGEDAAVSCMLCSASINSSTEITEDKEAMLDTLAVVDHETFDQLLEMDEGDPGHPFTREMVDNFFTQAKETFEKMDKALSSNDLPLLSRLGHFLKGSSAALGLLRMRQTCELIQHYGNCKESNGISPIEHDVALGRVVKIMAITKNEYEMAIQYLNDFLAGL